MVRVQVELDLKIKNYGRKLKKNFFYLAKMKKEKFVGKIFLEKIFLKKSKSPNLSEKFLDGIKFLLEIELKDQR